MDQPVKKLSILLIALLLGQTAWAGLPPTTSKISGDASDKVTFKYQFPNLTGTHTGTTVSLDTYPVPAPGTSGNVLTSNGSAWLSSSAASPTLTVVSKTANYTLISTDNVVLGDSSGGTFTLTLPTPVGISGKAYTLKKTDSSLTAIAVTGTGLSTNLSTIGESISVVSDGTNWVIYSRSIPSNRVTYSPTYTGFGTTSSDTTYYQRRGDSLFVQFWFQNGTNTAVLGSVSLPSGLSIDTAKIKNFSSTNDAVNVGQLISSLSGNANQITPMVVAVTTSATVVYHGKQYVNASPLVPDQPANMFSNNSHISGWFEVPISGWSN